ncbi:hypothetical protein [Hydrogenivirga sp. 128-5-R1-1]|uniref:hypothetical protein n=1 Tax=Hydrogenivirga sp. 128-5-R1-1 TaxID=392423 RepID=UPI00015EF9B3|nr:hypothetical protein [Hydrogenivirga sp. 128-5-R1-1]EDP75108.1 hypothetical protein HG1285_00050 [Hydrogenivirga sp. 128-5-R1-1]
MSQKGPTLKNCVWDILKSADEETLKEMLAISELGKKYLDIRDEKYKEEKRNLHSMLNFNTTKPIKYDLIKTIIENMNEAMTEGMGIVDKFRNMDKYPKQLQECVKALTLALERKAKDLKDEEWKRSLRKIREEYKNIELTCEQSIKLEEIIVDLLLDAYLRTMPKNDRENIVKQIIANLQKYASMENIDLSKVNVGYILTHGGLIALRQALGFKFHILTAIVINSIWNYTGALLAGSGLSLAVNAIIQRVVATVLGPLGWIIVIISTLALVSKLLNPREYDKYIPLVVYIYILRHNIHKTIETLKDLPE